jgi:hypothetical protein
MMKKRLAVRFGINCHLQVFKSSFSDFSQKKHIQIDPHRDLQTPLEITSRNYHQNHENRSTEASQAAVALGKGRCSKAHGSHAPQCPTHLGMGQNPVALSYHSLR